MRQIFDLGTFYADPHPGNRVRFFDFGLHGRIDRRKRRRTAMLLYALGKGDHEAVTNQLLHLSSRTWPAQIREFKDAVAELIGDWYGRTSSDFSVGRLLLGHLGLCALTALSSPATCCSRSAPSST